MRIVLYSKLFEHIKIFDHVIYNDRPPFHFMFSSRYRVAVKIQQELPIYNMTDTKIIIVCLIKILINYELKRYTNDTHIYMIISYTSKLFFNKMGK